MFPKEFIAYRKDRSRFGGGVFLLVHSSLRSSLLDVDYNDVESIWCTLTLHDNSSYAVGSFYRPPGSDLSTLQSLYEIISEVSQKPILLGGDFNLPDLHWGDGMCVTTTGCGIDIEMKSIIDTFGLVQYVQEPTRDKNVLDLFLFQLSGSS